MIDRGIPAPEGAREYQSQMPGLRKLASIRVSGGENTRLRLSDIGKPKGPLEIPRPEIKRLTPSPIRPESFHQVQEMPIFDASALSSESK